VSHEDDVARLRAEMDQAASAAKEMARAMRSFYAELSEQGFSEEQAMTLTLGWLTAMVRNSGGDDA
jgi:hypothetical protein